MSPEDRVKAIFMAIRQGCLLIADAIAKAYDLKQRN